MNDRSSARLSGGVVTELTRGRCRRDNIIWRGGDASDGDGCCI